MTLLEFPNAPCDTLCHGTYVRSWGLRKMLLLPLELVLLAVSLYLLYEENGHALIDAPDFPLSIGLTYRGAVVPPVFWVTTHLNELG